MHLEGTDHPVVCAGQRVAQEGSSPSGALMESTVSCLPACEDGVRRMTPGRGMNWSGAQAFVARSSAGTEVSRPI